jgi:hypothetical protein
MYKYVSGFLSIKLSFSYMGEGVSRSIMCFEACSHVKKLKLSLHAFHGLPVLLFLLVVCACVILRILCTYCMQFN